MMIYPIFFSLIALIAIIYLYNRIYQNKSPASYILWIIIWLFIIIFAFVPELSSKMAYIFGFERGIDFLEIAAILLIFYLIFKLYMKIDRLQQDIMHIVREIALNNEIIENEKEDEENNN